MMLITDYVQNAIGGNRQFSALRRFLTAFSNSYGYKEYRKKKFSLKNGDTFNLVWVLKSTVSAPSLRRNFDAECRYTLNQYRGTLRNKTSKKDKIIYIDSYFESRNKYCYNLFNLRFLMSIDLILKSKYMYNDNIINENITNSE